MTMPPPEDRAGALLAAVFSKVSQAISGPDRLLMDPADLQAEAQSFVDTGAPDQDMAHDADLTPIDLAELTMDQARQIFPITGEFGTDFGNVPFQSSVPFDPSGLPTPDLGQFLTTDSGLFRYTRGVGEAPDNRANANHPAYQARAQFMSEMYQFVLGSFNASGAGQHRDHNAPVTGARSPNSDHYSGGAFDVRASTPEEAKKIMAWAVSQPWVSFAQIYPDGKLIHISANVGAFTAGQPLPVIQRNDSTVAQPPSLARQARISNPFKKKTTPTPAPTVHTGSGGPQEF